MSTKVPSLIRIDCEGRAGQEITILVTPRMLRDLASACALRSKQPPYGSTLPFAELRAVGSGAVVKLCVHHRGMERDHDLDCAMRELERTSEQLGQALEQSDWRNMTEHDSLFRAMRAAHHRLAEIRNAPGN